jgi:hypothetical protein
MNIFMKFKSASVGKKNKERAALNVPKPQDEKL